MVDQSYGLRFDIYERIHLSENVVGIEELEEIELFPKIQVIPGDDYAALRGHLLLSGLYRGEGESRELEHWIPVEITIPLSRVHNLEEITVEIDNFDVDLLSARSLNITGVLSLQGIETTSLNAEHDEWNDREYIAAHEPQSSEERLSLEEDELSEELNQDEQEDVLSWNNSFASIQNSEFVENSAAEHSLEAESDNWLREAHAESKNEDDDSEQKVWILNTDNNNLSDEESVPVVQSEVDTIGAGLDSDHALPASTDLDTESSLEQLSQDAEPSRPQPEEKKELKVAFGSKKSAGETAVENFGITSLLSGQRIGYDQEHPDQLNGAEDAALVAANDSEREDLRWKNLFLRSGEHEPFRQVKLVIVQQEETLDDIAQRYHLSSRELQLYNRLSEQQLAEGQVLYIP